VARKSAPAAKVAKNAAAAPGKRTLTLKAHLDAFPGAVAEPYAPARATTPLILMYKVMGKLFAILAVRGEEYVILKSDFAEVLREQYEGVGHRSHLDKRFWISVSLDADVPPATVKKLAKASYQLICATLTKKQQADLAALK
jgi:predicted DNA-binding protein (MmcQ/YjbR family)